MLKEKDRRLEEMAAQLHKMEKDQQNTMPQLQDKDKILKEELKNKERQLQEALRQLKEKERQKKNGGSR